MGRNDATGKQFMEIPEFFIEFFNVLFRQNGDDLTVVPGSLVERDSTVTITIDELKGKVLERRNDLVRQVTLASGRRQGTAILCLEIQSFIRYEQALTNCLNISARQQQIAKTIGNRHEEEYRKTHPGDSEKAWSPLSLLEPKDRLPTVLQAVLYVGDNYWDAQDTLQKLTAVPLGPLRHYLPNCKTLVVTPATMTDEEIDACQTEFRALVICVKYKHNKEKLQVYLDTDPIFLHLSRAACLFIMECMHMEPRKRLKKNNNNLCQALQDMINEKVQEKNEQIQKQGKLIRELKQDRVMGIKQMLTEGLPLKKIADYTHMSLQKIQEIVAYLTTADDSQTTPNFSD